MERSPMIEELPSPPPEELPPFALKWPPWPPAPSIFESVLEASCALREGMEKLKCYLDSLAPVMESESFVRLDMEEESMPIRDELNKLQSSLVEFGTCVHKMQQRYAVLGRMPIALPCLGSVLDKEGGPVNQLFRFAKDLATHGNPKGKLHGALLVYDPDETAKFINICEMEPIRSEQGRLSLKNEEDVRQIRCILFGDGAAILNKDLDLVQHWVKLSTPPAVHHRENVGGTKHTSARDLTEHCGGTWSFVISDGGGVVSVFCEGTRVRKTPPLFEYDKSRPLAPSRYDKSRPLAPSRHASFEFGHEGHFRAVKNNLLVCEEGDLCRYADFLKQMESTRTRSAVERLMEFALKLGTAGHENHCSGALLVLDADGSLSNARLTQPLRRVSSNVRSIRSNRSHDPLALPGDQRAIQNLLLAHMADPSDEIPAATVFNPEAELLQHWLELSPLAVAAPANGSLRRPSSVPTAPNFKEVSILVEQAIALTQDYAGAVAVSVSAHTGRVCLACHGDLILKTRPLFSGHSAQVSDEACELISDVSSGHIFLSNDHARTWSGSTGTCGSFVFASRPIVMAFKSWWFRYVACLTGITFLIAFVVTLLHRKAIYASDWAGYFQPGCGFLIAAHLGRIGKPTRIKRLVIIIACSWAMSLWAQWALVDWDETESTWRSLFGGAILLSFAGIIALQEELILTRMPGIGGVLLICSGVFDVSFSGVRLAAERNEDMILLKISGCALLFLQLIIHAYRTCTKIQHYKLLKQDKLKFDQVFKDVTKDDEEHSEQIQLTDNVEALGISISTGHQTSILSTLLRWLCCLSSHSSHNMCYQRVPGDAKQSVEHFGHLYFMAELLNPIYQEIISELAASVEVSFKATEVKSRDRAMEKMWRCCWGQPHLLTDLCRNSLICANFKQVRRCLEEIKNSSNLRIIQIKNRYDVSSDSEASAGYRDVCLKLCVISDYAQRLKLDTHVVELRIIHSAFAKIINSSKGRDRYREWAYINREAS